MHGRLRGVAILVLIAGSTLTAGQSSPRPPSQLPTFTAGVEFVEVETVVTDRQGNAVTHLTRDDFEVFEDGKPQTVTAFGAVDVPGDVGPLTAFEATLEPDVQSNEQPFDGRVYVMVLDDLHVDALRSQSVQQSARLFIDKHLGRNDVMAVLTTGRDDASQAFTSNKRLLMTAVNKFIGRQLPSATLGANDAYHAQIDIASTNAKGSSAASSVQGGDDEYQAQLARHAESTLSTLRQVGQWLEGVHGRRKAVLLFSEGLTYNLSNLIGGAYVNGASRTFTAMQETLNATIRSNVSIYSIDPRGLSTTAADDITVSGFAGQNDRSTGIGLASLNAEMRLSQESLRQLSDASGGFAAVNRNDTARVFERIVRDNSSYYALGYYPVAKSDGKFHRIDVKVNRPGVTTRARSGYVAPSTRTTKPSQTNRERTELQDAMNSLLPVSGLTMRLFAAPLKGSKKNASVVVSIELNGRDLSVAAGNKIEVSFAAVNQRSAVVGARHDTLPLTVDFDTRARIERGAVRLVNLIALPPGRYRLHAAALDNQKHRVGSVLSDLEVPDFYKEPFTMSGVMVTSRAGADMLTAVGDDQLRTLLPSPVSALRTFAQDDELDLFAEVYDAGKAPHTIDLLTTVFTRDGQQVGQSAQVHDSKELRPENRGLRYKDYLPLSRLLPGDYVLQVEARSRLTTDAWARRQVTFRVVPTQKQLQP